MALQPAFQGRSFAQSGMLVESMITIVKKGLTQVPTVALEGARQNASPVDGEPQGSKDGSPLNADVVSIAVFQSTVGFSDDLTRSQ